MTHAYKICANFDLKLLRNDSIFYIHAASYSSGPCLIYGLLAENGTMKWNKLAKFGSSKIEMNFPEIIRPMMNGNFIFFSRQTRSSYAENSTYGDLILDVVEFWEIDQSIRRIPMQLPLNLTDDLETLLVFQL